MPGFRAGAFELRTDGDTIKADLAVAECSDIADLAQHITAFQNRPAARRVIQVEVSSLPLETHDNPDPELTLQAQLGRLGVPADFLSAHISHGTLFIPDEINIRTRGLPTASSAEDRWTVEYFELLDYTGKTEDLQFPCPVSGRRMSPGDGALTLSCAETGRQLQFHQWQSQEGWLIVAPRKCSFWSVSNAGGWTAVFLLDPSPTRALVADTHQTVSLQPRKPFRGGRPEFIPLRYLLSANQSFLMPLSLVQSIQDVTQSHENETDGAVRVNLFNRGAQLTAIKNELGRNVAPKTSFFNDLRYYFARYSCFLDDLSHPSHTTLFPLKLVASHYCLLHAFVNYQLSVMRSIGWAVRRETQQQIDEADQVETSWSQFRCADYLEAVELILETLGISYADEPLIPNHYNREQNYLHAGRPRAPRINSFTTFRNEDRPDPAAWKSHAADFLYLHRLFHLRHAGYDIITTSIAALAGMIGGRLGITEARTAKKLTYIAVLFAPLAWVAGVFSMASQFSPGEPLFWKYWIVAVPVTFGVWLVFFGIHERMKVAGIARQRGWSRHLRWTNEAV